MPYGAVFGLIFLAISGCASTPPPISYSPDMERVWPVPPDAPRIAYVHTFKLPADIGVREGVWARLVKRLAGSQEPPSIEAPMGLYADERGWLLVADTGLQVVHIFNRIERTYVQAFRLPNGRLGSPVGVAYDPERRWIFVSDTILNQIFVYDTEGYYVASFGTGLSRPSGLAWDAKNGELYAVDTGNHRVVVFGKNGEQVRVLGKRGEAPGEFNFPTHVTLDGDGNLYVADTLNFRVQRLSPAGKSLGQIGSLGSTVGSFSKPKGVAIGPSGNLLVVDGIYDVVQLFDDKGAVLMHFGGAGSQPGRFWLPAGLAVTGNDIFVADTHNSRVQMFRLLPDPSEPETGGG